MTLEGAKARRGRQYLKQIRAGPQGPRLMADEGVKGVMMVDSPPHQPQKKKKKEIKKQLQLLRYRYEPGHRGRVQWLMKGGKE